MNRKEAGKSSMDILSDKTNELCAVVLEKNREFGGRAWITDTHQSIEEDYRTCEDIFNSAATMTRMRAYEFLQGREWLGKEKFREMVNGAIEEVVGRQLKSLDSWEREVRKVGTAAELNKATWDIIDGTWANAILIREVGLTFRRSANVAGLVMKAENPREFVDLVEKKMNEGLSRLRRGGEE